MSLKTSQIIADLSSLTPSERREVADAHPWLEDSGQAAGRSDDTRKPADRRRPELPARPSAPAHRFAAVNWHG